MITVHNLMEPVTLHAQIAIVTIQTYGILQRQKDKHDDRNRQEADEYELW